MYKIMFGEMARVLIESVSCSNMEIAYFQKSVVLAKRSEFKHFPDITRKILNVLLNGQVWV